MEVTSELKIYEINGRDVAVGDETARLLVRSHWNRREFVVLQVQANVSVTVDAEDLTAAIQNAQNSRRF